MYIYIIVYIYIYICTYIYIYVYIYIHITAKPSSSPMVRPALRSTPARRSAITMKDTEITIVCLQFSISEQLLRSDEKRFRGGLVFKARRLLYQSTLGRE